MPELSIILNRLASVVNVELPTLVTVALTTTKSVLGGGLSGVGEK